MFLGDFSTMCPFWTKVEQLNDLSLPAQKAAMMWAVFQCHRVMEEFKSLKFESHPAIIWEISMFVITKHVDPEQVVTLTLELKKAKEENKRLSNLVNNLDAGFASLKWGFNNLKNEFEQYMKKPK